MDAFDLIDSRIDIDTLEEFEEIEQRMAALEDQLRSIRFIGSLMRLARAFEDHPFVTQAYFHWGVKDFQPKPSNWGMVLHIPDAQGAPSSAYYPESPTPDWPFGKDNPPEIKTKSAAIDSALTHFAHAFQQVISQKGLLLHSRQAAGLWEQCVAMTPGDAASLARTMFREDLAREIERRALAKASISTAPNVPSIPARSL